MNDPGGIGRISDPVVVELFTAVQLPKPDSQFCVRIVDGTLFAVAKRLIAVPLQVTFALAEADTPVGDWLMVTTTPVEAALTQFVTVLVTITLYVPLETLVTV